MAPITNGFYEELGEALKALKKLHHREPVDVVHVHLPLISWTRKQFQSSSINSARCKQFTWFMAGRERWHEISGKSQRGCNLAKPE